MTAPTPLHEESLPQALVAASTGEAVVVDESQPRPSGLKVSPRRANATLVTLTVMAFLLVTQEIAPIGMISAIAADLGTTEARVGLLTTAFTLANMIATLPLALLTTRWGRRNATVLAGVIWTSGVLVIALSSSFEMLLAGRAITGAAHALWWAVAGPGVAGIFAPAVRGKRMTQLQIGSASAGVVGLPLATVAVSYVDWHTPFWVLLAGGVVVTALTWILMPNYRTAEGSAPTGDLPSWAAWMRVLTVLILMAASMGVTWTYIQPVLTTVSGFSDAAMPWLFAMGGTLGVASTVVLSMIVDRFPVKAVGVAVSLMMGAWVLLAAAGTSQAAAVAALVLQAIGWAGIVSSLIAWSMRHTPLPSDIGIGTHGMVYNAGFAAGSFAGAWLFSGLGAANLPWVSAGLVAAAAVLVLTVARRDLMRLRTRRRHVLV